MAVTPKDIATNCLTRAQALLKVNASPQVLDDLSRLALVMGVAALDAYMHALVLGRVSKLQNSLPKSLENLEVPLGDVVDLATTVKRNQASGRSSRPWAHVKSSLHRRLLEKTFQRPAAIADAISMCGVAKGWSKVAVEMKAAAVDVEVRLGGIVHRRNQIVHEGDHIRLVRPQKVKLNRILSSDVQDDLAWIESLISAIDKVAT